MREIQIISISIFQKGDFIASFVDEKKIGKTKNTSNLPTMLAKAKEML